MSMYEVDRMIAILRPTQHFVDWANSHVESEDEKIALNILQDDCTALLLPPFESIMLAEEYITDRYLEIFENELEGWHVDTSLWPENRSYELFSEWFTLEYHSLAFDLAETDYEEAPFASETLQ